MINTNTVWVTWKRKTIKRNRRQHLAGASSCALTAEEMMMHIPSWKVAKGELLCKRMATNNIPREIFTALIAIMGEMMNQCIFVVRRRFLTLTAFTTNPTLEA
jgi:hypothetical protein